MLYVPVCLTCREEVEALGKQETYDLYGALGVVSACIPESVSKVDLRCTIT